MRFIISVVAILFTVNTLSGQPAGVTPLPQGMLSSWSWSPNSKLPEKNVIAKAAGQPPSITYGTSRRATGTIIAFDTNNPVDDGIEWEGRAAYLCLHHRLLVVDMKTKKTLWADIGNSFWETLTFINVAKKDEKPHWVIALGSTEFPSYQQRFDLDTGKKHELIGGPPAPTGTPIKPRSSFIGSAGKYDKKLYRIVSTPEDWVQLRDKLFGGRLPNLPEASEIDFKKETMLVCYEGKSTYDAGGISDIDLAVESKERLLLRVNRFTTQVISTNFSPNDRISEERKEKEYHPYYIAVLPVRPGKPIVLEGNDQRYLGGPPMWKEFKRLGK